MIAQHRSLFSAWTTNVPGRRRGDFVDSVEHANIYAVHAQTSDASGAATPYIGRCELAPTTAVRPHAQVKYSKRFRAAYGHHRSRAGVPRRSSGTISLASRTDRHRDVGLPLTLTSLAHPRHSHRPAIPSFSMDRPPKPNCPGPRHERHQDVQSRCRRIVSRAKIRAVAGLRAEGVDGMNGCDHHVSCHRYARLRPSRTAGIADPLSARMPQDLRPRDTRTTSCSCQTGHRLRRRKEWSGNLRFATRTNKCAVAPGASIPSCASTVYRRDANCLRRHHCTRLRIPNTGSATDLLSATVGRQPGRPPSRKDDRPLQRVSTIGHLAKLHTALHLSPSRSPQ